MDKPPPDRTDTVAKAVIPVIEERLKVGTRQREVGRVRITKRVHEIPSVIHPILAEDEVTVEHVPINRVIKEPPSVRTRGNTIIIPVVEEQIVVEKRLVLREEIRIRKRRRSAKRSQTVVLRKEEVVIERLQEQTPPPSESQGPDG